MLSFSTTICTLDNMTPEWKRLSVGRLTDTTSGHETKRKPIPRDEYRNGLNKRVRVYGYQVDFTVDSISDAARWLGVVHSSVSKAIKGKRRITRIEDGKKYNIEKVSE